MINNNIFLKITISMILVITAGIIFFLIKAGGDHTNDNKITTEQKENDCAITEEGKIVRGGSLAGIIAEGDEIIILKGFYECNEVKRGDIVAYDYTGNSAPIIKIIRGVPGDKFEFAVIKKSAWNILINGEILKNSLDEPYILGEQGHKMLKLYEHDYNGVIPKDTYLILGNKATGSTDSAKFGLVGKPGFIGKVIKELHE